MNKHVDRLKVMFGAAEVGMLAVGDRGQIFFEYAPQWLTTGFDLAPRGRYPASASSRSAPVNLNEPWFDK
jgi:hypothetical protein